MAATIDCATSDEPTACTAVRAAICPGTLLAASDDHYVCGVTGTSTCPSDGAEQAKCPSC